MDNSIKSPLISLILVAYNQESFIREAIEGALSQDYSPLEIILSDDCSTDRTFLIMEECVARYTGENPVQLIRMESNLGLTNHLNRAIRRASGVLLVLCAGDDVSRPERCRELGRLWSETGKPSGIGSAVRLIDVEGRSLGSSSGCHPFSAVELNRFTRMDYLNRYLGCPDFCITGCAAAWTPELWSVFGDIPESVINEDTLLSFRSCILHGLKISTAELVAYRQHSSSCWSTGGEGERLSVAEVIRRDDKRIFKAQARCRLMSAMQKDLEVALKAGWVCSSDATNLSGAMELEKSKASLIVNWWNMTFLEKVLRLQEIDGSVLSKLLRIFPRKAYVCLYVIGTSVRSRCLGTIRRSHISIDK